MPVYWNCRARPHRVAGADAALPGILLGMGSPNRRLDRGALQPDELSQRVDLAARQRAHRLWAVALRTPGAGPADSDRTLSKRTLLRIAANARAVLRFCEGPRRGAGALPSGLFATGLVSRVSVPAAASRAWAGNQRALGAA